MTFGNRISRLNLKNLMWVCFFLFGAYSPSHACELNPNEAQAFPLHEDSLDLSRILENLGQSTIRERTFHETYYSGMLTTPSHKEGRLIFHPPSRLEKHVQSPAIESFIAEGDNLLYENPSREISQTFSLQDYPALAALIEGLRSLFNGDEDTLRQVFHVSLTSTSDKWQLNLSPKTHHEEDGVNCIRLAGNDVNLQTISIYETNGDRSELLLDSQVP